ncbi:MAG: N-6 DNA methylase [Proteobacteria bacterium]|nr:N-6 DNA methylase [Pseudomonadota bacterium]
MKDADIGFHKEWIGLAQPVEGLVFSWPVLAAAQIAPKVRSSLTAELEAHLDDTDHGVAVRDVRQFFVEFLGYDRPGMLVPRAELPADLKFYAPEGRQEVRPSFAIARGPFKEAGDDPFAEFAGSSARPSTTTASDPQADSPYLALVWDLSDDADDALDIDLDKNESLTGPWRYPPTAKLERLLRHTGIPIGFVSNRRELRVVYAPPGESTGHLTFRFRHLIQPNGRKLVAALELIFHARQTYEAGSEFTFEGLLRESRLRQAEVTKDLAAQVFEAVEILLEGFEHAAARDCTGDRIDWLRAALEEPEDHFYQGILSVVLRVVFLLYSEDQSLLPVQHPTYAKHLSVLGLYEDLVDDAGAHPESMHLRFGAYGRLIALFRAVFLGVHHEDLRLPPRRGRLFDPSAFPFLEGGLPGWTAAITLPEQRAAVQLPSIDDGTLYRVLHRLIVFEGQRLSYRSLDVEQIGAVYESLMGYHVLRMESPAVRLGKQRVWVETERVRTIKPSDRKKLWKETCGLSTTAAKKAEAAVKGAEDAAGVAEALGELTPGSKSEKPRHRVATGRLVLQPGEERRRTGSHYTPRWLSEKVVRRTLEPILACLGEGRTADQILSLKICDPAMGSGAFLVAACRLLAEEVVAAWDRAGEAAALTEEHGDALLHARRLVAQRCLYGVDKNAAAVELAKLSLWLVTLSKELPFTFVDHSLRHGDSLVGLDLEQIKSFHWEPKEQLETCRRVLEDALEQALEHRDQILALADKEDAESQREKQRLLEYAEQATARVRMIADLCVGAFFAEGKTKARENERARRLELLRRLLEGDESIRSSLQHLAANIHTQLSPFHWHSEFPEVFYQQRSDPLSPSKSSGAAYFEAIVGNPPFAGSHRITALRGKTYSEWIKHAFRADGFVDYSAFFVAQSAPLLGPSGAFGMLSTSGIAEGDSRDVSLRRILESGYTIIDAIPRTFWPGDAAVEYASTVATVGIPIVPVIRLDGEAVALINSSLKAAPERASAQKLLANAGLIFAGHELGTRALVFPTAELNHLSEADGVLPFLDGPDLTRSAQPGTSQSVVALWGMSEEQASSLTSYEALKANGAQESSRSSRWWRLKQERRGILEYRGQGHSRFLVVCRHGKHPAFWFVDSNVVPDFGLNAILLWEHSTFAILQSRVHCIWRDADPKTLAGHPRYLAGVFETFPFPHPDPRTIIDSLEAIGNTLYETRAKFMLDTDQGLTKTYNALKDPDHDDPRVLELRRLHEEMDRAVLGAYGWPDIEVPPFCPKTDEDRAALQEFEDEVIDRLYVLNAERAREEERLGARKKKGSKRSKGNSRRSGKKKASSEDAAAADDTQGELF